MTNQAVNALLAVLVVLSIYITVNDATHAIRLRQLRKKKVPKGLRGVIIVPSAEGISLPDPDTEMIRAFLANNLEEKEKK